MLQELEALIEDERPAVADEIEAGLRNLARLLLEKQFIFADDPMNGRRFELARQYRGYLEKLFDALGYRLVFEEHAGAIGIIAQGNAVSRPMRRDHALFLLGLRAIFETAVKDMVIEERGRFTTTLSEVWSLIEERARGIKRPNPSQSRGIADDFQKRGIIRIKDQDVASRDVAIEIRHVIRLVVTLETADSLARYATAVEQGDEDADEETTPEVLSGKHVCA